ncbi:MAG: FtsX-like permease family protein, partial [Clostridium sp.]
MGIYAYAKQILKADFKYTLNYLIAISVLTLFVFNGINVALNSAILNTSENIEILSESMGATHVIRVDILQKEKLLWFIIVVILFSAFCNNYFVSRKTKEVGFAIVNGSPIHDVTKFLLFQNGVLFLLASIIGVLLGFMTMPLFNMLIYNITDINGNLFYLSKEAIIYTFLIIL